MGVPAWKYSVKTEYLVVVGEEEEEQSGGSRLVIPGMELQHSEGFHRLNSTAVDHLSLQKLLQGNKIKGTPQTVASVYVRER